MRSDLLLRLCINPHLQQPGRRPVFETGPFPERAVVSAPAPSETAMSMKIDGGGRQASVKPPCRAVSEDAGLQRNRMIPQKERGRSNSLGRDARERLALAMKQSATA